MRYSTLDFFTSISSPMKQPGSQLSTPAPVPQHDNGIIDISGPDEIPPPLPPSSPSLIRPQSQPQTPKTSPRTITKNQKTSVEIQSPRMPSANRIPDASKGTSPGVFYGQKDKPVDRLVKTRLNQPKLNAAVVAQAKKLDCDARKLEMPATDLSSLEQMFDYPGAKRSDVVVDLDNTGSYETVRPSHRTESRRQCIRTTKGVTKGTPFYHQFPVPSGGTGISKTGKIGAMQGKSTRTRLQMLSPQPKQQTMPQSIDLEGDRKDDPPFGQFPVLSIITLVEDGKLLAIKQDDIKLKAHENIEFSGIFGKLSIPRRVITKILYDVPSPPNPAFLGIMRTDQSCIVCQVATQEIDRLIRLLPSRPLGSILDKANKQEVALLHFEFNKGIKKRKRTGDEDEELDTPNTKSQAKPKFPPHQELFRYPMEGKNAVSVRQEDYDRLDDGEFLNDVVIEFMLKHLILGSPEKLQEQVHHFNTFFYEQLSFKDDQARKGGAPETSGYDRVKKWTSKVDLFSKKYIFVPINENMHWYLALIYNPGALLKQNEVEEDFSAEDLATSLAVEASLFSDRPQTRNVGDEPLLRGTDETAMVVDEPRMDTKPCGIDASSLPADDSLVELKDLDVAQIQEGVHTMDIDLPASFVIDSEDVDSEVFQSMKGPYTYKSKGKGRKKLTAEEEAERKLRDAERHQAKTAESQKQCHIIILDSLHAKHAGAIRRLKGYLAAEAEAKLQVTIDQKEIQGIHAKVPVQPNHCDCGIYLLYYVEVFLKDPRKYLNIIFNRLNADQDWFALQDVQTKRSEGKQLMNRLTTQYQELTAKAAPPKQGAAAAPATSANRPPQTPTQPKKTLHPLRPPPALSPGGPPQQPQPPKRNRIAEYREETKRKELLQASQ